METYYDKSGNIIVENYYLIEEMLATKLAVLYLSIVTYIFAYMM